MKKIITILFLLSYGFSFAQSGATGGVKPGTNVTATTGNIQKLTDTTANGNTVLRDIRTKTTNGTQRTKISNGTANVAVKSGAVAAAGIDSSLVVTIHPNSASLPIRLGVTDYVQSSGNNTSAQLAAGATFTGTIETSLSYPQLIVSIRSNQNITIFIDQYSDLAGTIQYPTITRTRVANAGFNEPITLSGSYYRVRIQNTSGAATTNLFAETWLGIIPATPNITNLGNLPVSVSEINGTATSVNSGISDAGTQRVVLANTPIATTDIASAAIATSNTTAAITPLGGVSAVFEINVTAVASSPTYQVNIEQSFDNGTTWQVLYSFPTITATGQYFSAKLPINGTRLRYVQTVGGTGNVTRSITRTMSNDDVNLVYKSVIGSMTTTITTGGTAQTLLLADPIRQGFEIQNNSTAELRFCINCTASATNGFALAPASGSNAGGAYSSPASRTATGQITIFGATTGQQFTVISY